MSQSNSERIVARDLVNSAPNDGVSEKSAFGDKVDYIEGGESNRRFPGAA
ncbi:MAG TPA: hypothetical protein VK633_14540 [Verrucomicrobiae bacterium]|nr:hypothetical protein [Verrucomicrobiae bacterium]